MPQHRQRRAALVLAVLLLLLAASPGLQAASKADVDEVGKQLVCYCGCSGLTVHACTCGTADGIREKISGQLDAGLTTDEVVAAWVAERGEQVLAVPTREGFNLVGWFLPFVLTLLGLAAVTLVVLRWQKRPEPVPAAAGDEAMDVEYLRRLEQDMKELRR